MGLHEGARVRNSLSGREAVVVRQMPANTAPGHEDEEAEPVFELDDLSLAPRSALELLEAAPASEKPAEESAPVAEPEASSESAESAE